MPLACAGRAEATTSAATGLFDTVNDARRAARRVPRAELWPAPVTTVDNVLTALVPVLCITVEHRHSRPKKRFALLPVSAERFGSSSWRAPGRDVDQVIDAYFDPSHG
jgi:hypothetical protein